MNHDIIGDIARAHDALEALLADSGTETSGVLGVFITDDRRCSWVTSIDPGQNRLKRLIW